MRPIYELWDIPTANLIDAYETEEAALADVLYSLEVDGARSVEAMVLLRDDRDDESKHLVAQGLDLAEYARNARTRLPASGPPMKN